MGQLLASILSSVTLTWFSAAQSGGAKKICSDSGPKGGLCFFQATLIVRTFTAFSADSDGAKSIHLQMEPKEWFSSAIRPAYGRHNVGHRRHNVGPSTSHVLRDKEISTSKV